MGSSPTRGSSFFLGKVTALGVLCCFALFVCLTLLASFFLPSHLSFKNMYIHTSIVTYVHTYKYAMIRLCMYRDIANMCTFVLHYYESTFGDWQYAANYNCDVDPACINQSLPHFWNSAFLKKIVAQPSRTSKKLPKGYVGEGYVI